MEDRELQVLAEIVGAANVSTDSADLDSYSHDESYALAIMPRAIVRPGSEDEVFELVAWANRTLTPLIPVSSAGPHFNGDTVPSVSGVVVLDLRRLNRIRRVDRRNRVVVIEPGVTYQQLAPVLATEGMRVTPPLRPRAGKSVIASLLERQPTLIPRYNYSLPEPLRDCGVVWGSGERSYTGEAGLGSFNLQDQWDAGSRQVDPKGPAQTDFFRFLTGAQGSMGIVTWVSVKCELLPTAGKLLFAPAARLEELVDFVYRLVRLRLGDELLILNGPELARLMSQGLDQERALTGTLPAWVLLVGVRGRELYASERVAVQEIDIADVAASYGIHMLDTLTSLETASVEAALAGVSRESDWRLGSMGATRRIFFLTTLDKAAGYLQTVEEIARRRGYPVSDIGIYVQPQHQGVSHHVEVSLPFNPSDRRRAALVKEIYADASEALIAGGAYFSRPYGSWAGLVYNRDAASADALRKVKHIFDPSNVMNPSKLCF
jgi:FAD/FMN-containing dehydrogenase